MERGPFRDLPIAGVKRLSLAARVSAASIHVGGVSSGELCGLRKKRVQKVAEPTMMVECIAPLSLSSITALSLHSKRVDAKNRSSVEVEPLWLLLHLIFSYFWRRRYLV
jgi:hypothetical protein